ncbi:hypothetical protein PMAYCL1PPCAC_30949 [Pristionchus mayeri]|uniref:Peptidase M13 C-terminal domain-containing protein n=1 Tax=Pristionchus mayeri TaxID=1317129 RepID=A0AAN5DCU3_9BILA|nr:hypothetical protein PMAYCL1PPCAC_30949 [Pristionchus mayeri]
MLIHRVDGQMRKDAYYHRELNKVAILAPYLYPQLTDNSTLNKNYGLFYVIGHEMFHSVVNQEWAEKSSAFNNGLSCLISHYERTCGLYGEGSCNSGNQTFREDGADLEGLRNNYEFLAKNYNEEELNEFVHKSDSLTVNRRQALFYLFGIDWCYSIKKIDNHTNVHSPPQVRVNGVVTQMPEFSQAFSCSPGQAMFTDKEQTCNLFGPDSK